MGWKPRGQQVEYDAQSCMLRLWQRGEPDNDLAEVLAAGIDAVDLDEVGMAIRSGALRVERAG